MTIPFLSPIRNSTYDFFVGTSSLNNTSLSLSVIRNNLDRIILKQNSTTSSPYIVAQPSVSQTGSNDILIYGTLTNDQLIRGTNASFTTLSVQNLVQSGSGFVVASDLRIKENIADADIKKEFDKVLRMKVKN